MPVEWVWVVLKGSDAPPARVNKKHFEDNLKEKGFVLESSAKKSKKEDDE